MGPHQEQVILYKKIIIINKKYIFYKSKRSKK